MNNIATPRLQLFGRPAPNVCAAPPGGADPPDPHAWLTDFLGGRVLAWLGGVATLLAIVLLLVLAISRGWIGEPERVGVAGAASALLMAAGIWLHSRRGRTEAAVAMVGAATAGGFATLVVAGEIYRLIPALVAVAGSVLIGALATALAIRWAGRAIAAIGLIGALISPVLVGAYSLSVFGLMSGGATIAILGVATACAIGIVIWRRWPALGLIAMLLATPQWVLWLIAGHSSAVDLCVLTGFGLLGLACAVGAQVRSLESDVVAALAGSLALVNAALVGIVARVTVGPILSGIYLAGLGTAYAGVALWAWPRLAIHPTLRRLLIAIGVLIVDVALSLLIHGPFLSAAWGAGAVGSAWLMRRSESGAADGRWLGVALGEHVALVLARALIALPPGQISSAPQLEPILSVGLLAATCLICARASGADHAMGRMALDVLGLGAIGYLTLATLDGAALVGAWTGEAIALAEVARRGMTSTEPKPGAVGDPVAWHGSLVFLGAAAMYAVAMIARPNALVIGVPDLGQAALALGVLTFGALRTGLVAPRGTWLRRGLLATSAISLLYLASVAVITAFQPAPGSVPDTLLDLGVRQQGQVLLSALWGVVGVGTLIAGLRRKNLWLRSAALGLLLTTVAKVFLYDLSTLTSLYRVVSFFVLGGLLLAGAFSYQRLRPPPPPDLRSLHPSQR